MKCTALRRQPRRPEQRAAPAEAGVSGARGSTAAGDHQRTSGADDGSATRCVRAIGIANTAGTPTSINIELGTSPATITLELGQLELTNTTAADYDL